MATTKLRLGAVTPASLRVGSAAAPKAYLGSTLVWDTTVSGPAVVATGQTSAASAVASYTIALTVPAGANRLLLVGASMYSFSNADWTSVTSNVDGALTRAAQIRNTSDLTRLALWAKLAPTVGAHTLTVTHSATSRGGGVWLCLANVHQTTPYGSAVTAQDLSATPTVRSGTLTMTGAAADKLSVGELAIDPATFTDRDLVPSGGATEHGEYSVNNGGHLSVVSLAAAPTLTWTWAAVAGNPRWVAVGLVINGP